MRYFLFILSYFGIISLGIILNILVPNGFEIGLGNYLLKCLGYYTIASWLADFYKK